MGAPLWRLLIHDWSKFTPAEWFPYLEHFYGKDRGQPNRPSSKLFPLAWNHHVHYNPHHWNHWIMIGNSGKQVVFPMPEHFVREMVADWMGAGRELQKTWNPVPWYEKEKGKIVLHEDTRKLVEELLPLAAQFHA